MKNPSWVKGHLHNYKFFEEIPQKVFDDINRGLDKIQSNNPLVSVVITAWNEETNILRTISSLSKMESRHPFEIIVINNNSTDRTQDTLDKLNVKNYFQPVQGWGAARQLGLNVAEGKYILTGDADAIYSRHWLNEMMEQLTRPGVVCVYGRYSFIGEPGYPRWLLSFHEKLKDVVAELRHINRPYLNSYGLNMGYIKECALEVGYVMAKIRGEDGRMCFDLMKFGKVKQVRSNKARVWTYPRALKRDGSFLKAIFYRIKKEINRLPEMFYPMPAHDTKISKNEVESV